MFECDYIAAPKEGTIEFYKQHLANLHGLISDLYTWHEDNLAHLNHLLAFPEEDELIVENHATGEEVNIIGEERKAFFTGIEVAIASLKEFPLQKVATEEEPTE